MLEKPDAMDDDFFEEDEPIEDIVAAWNAAEARGEIYRTQAPIGYRCEHTSITGGGLKVLTFRAWCGCRMRPIF